MLSTPQSSSIANTESALLREEQYAVAYATFMTPELLEMIMLNLPIYDILINAQRVCKHWQTTIAGSTKL